MMKKVAIIGPESTGKSTLCEQLAIHYSTEWLREYAREYLLAHGSQYRYEDLLPIAQEQAASEDRLVARLQETGSASVVFIDTDQYVMKVWCEYVYQQCHAWILDEIAERKYDLYLLCDTDLPWVRDELREYPDLKSRRELYFMYKDIMVNQSVPWVNISGGFEQRFQLAVKTVDFVLHEHL